MVLEHGPGENKALRSDYKRNLRLCLKDYNKNVCNFITDCLDDSKISDDMVKKTNRIYSLVSHHVEDAGIFSNPQRKMTAQYPRRLNAPQTTRPKRRQKVMQVVKIATHRRKLNKKKKNH